MTTTMPAPTHPPRAADVLTGILEKKKETKLRQYTMPEIAELYAFGRDLGMGNFATVRQCTNKKTGKVCAAKIIDKSLCNTKRDMIGTELAILKKVRHRYVVGMDEVFDTSGHLFLILDYVSGGELFDRIVNAGSFTESDASRITRQLAEGLQYLHTQGVVHRDLKPENLLFRDPSPDADILITDFGLAKMMADDAAMTTACGTPQYVAPEILAQRLSYDEQVDVWSLGVIVYVMMCGYPPFYHDNEMRLFEIIMQGSYKFDDAYWGEVSAACKGMIRELLLVDPVARFTTSQILLHPWITGADSLPKVNLSKSISMNLKKTVKRDDSTTGHAASTATVKMAAVPPPTAVAAVPKAKPAATPPRGRSKSRSSGRRPSGSSSGAGGRRRGSGQDQPANTSNLHEILRKTENRTMV